MGEPTLVRRKRKCRTCHADAIKRFGTRLLQLETYAYKLGYRRTTGYLNRALKECGDEGAELLQRLANE